MNLEDEVNRFQVGLRALVEDVTRELPYTNVDPFGSGFDEAPKNERETRAWFHDRLLALLGWDLGIGGDIIQETRVKDGSRYFIDYVGLKTQQPPAPVLLLEAKPWGQPWVAARTAGQSTPSSADLIVAGLQHVSAGGQKDTAPVNTLWHDHLEQASDYANAVYASGANDVSRLILSSGDWMVVFTQPIATFVDRKRVDASHVELFAVADYVKHGRRIFELLSRWSLADQIPFALRVGQLGSYLAPDIEYSVYHGVHVTYQVSGSELFARVPRILVYAAIVFERDDGTTVSVIDEKADELPGSTEESNGRLRDHLTIVASHASALLHRCSDEMGRELKPGELSRFGSFPRDNVFDEGVGRKVVKPLKMAPDEWLFVTGQKTHFLRERPSVEACRFHEWRKARDSGNGIGPGAVNTPCVVETRAFFVDGEAHHCAHQVVVDRRWARCQIAPLDGRVCCRACVYERVCWANDEIAALPCGT
ncbi:MAG: hypothetical protein OXK76_16295 [Gammaproteobacteria bacterium]|nr:hypothetical protein [Gammaproteobacteria bacterium]